MNNEDKTTSAGKWSVALAIIPAGGILLFLLPIRLGEHSGDCGLGALAALGAILYGGTHIAAVTSLLGGALGIFAIVKTRWKQGVLGLVLNISVLIASGSYITSLYYSIYTDQDRLPIAAHHGKKKTVQKLLARGFDINRQFSGGTALSNAAGRGYEDIVKLLLARGADVNICNPVAAAASAGNEEIVILLLERGAYPTGLHGAVESNHKESVQMLLDHGADIDAGDSKGNGRTPLHTAAAWHSDMVELLVANGANVNARDSDGETPLHTLARTAKQKTWVVDHRERVVDMLLSAGADLEAKTKKGKTPLHLAAQRGLRDAIRLLLERGADVENVKGAHLRLVATPISGDRTVLERWVRTNAQDVNAKNKRGDSLLHWVVKGGNESVVEILLELGPDVNARNRDGDTPLHWAVIRDPQLEISELLISKGADINIGNNRGDTPLHIALCISKANRAKPQRQTWKELIEMLLAKGAMVDLKNDHGYTPLMEMTNWLPRSKEECQYQNEVLQLMRTYQKKSDSKMEY